MRRAREDTELAGVRIPVIAIVAATIGARWRLVPADGEKVYAKVKATMRPNRLPMTVLPRRG